MSSVGDETDEQRHLDVTVLVKLANDLCRYILAYTEYRLTNRDVEESEEEGGVGDDESEREELDDEELLLQEETLEDVSRTMLWAELEGVHVIPLQAAFHAKYSDAFLDLGRKKIKCVMDQMFRKKLYEERSDKEAVLTEQNKQLEETVASLKAQIETRKNKDVDYRQHINELSGKLDEIKEKEQLALERRRESSTGCSFEDFVTSAHCSCQTDTTEVETSEIDTQTEEEDNNEMSEVVVEGGSERQRQRASWVLPYAAPGRGSYLGDVTEYSSPAVSSPYRSRKSP